MKHLISIFAAALLVALAPSAVAQTTPPDVSADAVIGKTVTLSVTAQGTQPFTYQWERANIGSTAFAPVNGATSASLVFPALAAANVGVYRVRITNVAGSITSPTATVRLATSPSIESFTITVGN